jgi:Ca2+-binding EF-hand superfamily protein
MKKILLLAAGLLLLTSPSLAENAVPAKREAMREKMQKQMQSNLAAMDTNGDGKIEKTEFLAKSEERFKRMDANGDGAISAEEMKTMHGKMQGSPGGAPQH